MFTDSIALTLTAGKGGNGIVAWRREKYIPKGGPYGGNGGPGASIYLEADHHTYALDHLRFKRRIFAENGGAGGPNNRQGKRGKDLILKVPVGTLIHDAHTGEILADLTKDKEKIQICMGGDGGKGNTFFKSPTNRTPARCTPGKPGEEKEIKLELKLIADVGLVGFPNAGKSTLLSSLSGIKVKSDSYPFTTLKPNLSFVEFEDYSRIYIADIPGIIEDAHLNKGLGHQFLKHIERTNTLVYLIDLSGIDGRDPIKDFQILHQELKCYSENLIHKPFLIALNKVDTEEGQTHLDRFQQQFPQYKEQTFAISAKEHLHLSPFLQKLRTSAQRDGKNFR